MLRRIINEKNYYIIFLLGGDFISKLINLFFIIYFFNFFIFIYSIYTFLDIIFFHNLQGSKLKLKKELINKNK